MDFQNITLIHQRHNFSVFGPRLPSETIFYSDLTIVTKGKLIYRVNGKKYTVNENAALFLPYGSTRSRMENEGVDFISFNFICETALEFPIITENFVDEEVVALIKLYDLFSKNKHGSFKEQFIEIIRSLLLKLYDYYNAPSFSKLTTAIITYLNQNITKNLTLAEIETAVFYTPNYFNEKFKMETGLSVIKYFNLLKMERAKTLILEQTQTLEEIAYFLGFSDYNYFSRLFKQTYHLSPYNYRKQFIIKSN